MVTAPNTLGRTPRPGTTTAICHRANGWRGLRIEKRRTMAYGVVHHFPGGTEEQYEASVAAVHPGPDQLPEGQIFHAAGPSEGGWTVMAVHDSQASWEKFRD